MYHEMTYEELAYRRRRRIIAGILCVLFFLILVLLGRLLAHISQEQAVVSLKESIQATAQQCAAVEGSYPSSLEHLENRYGLVINHEDYLVTYEWFADNIPPTVTVVPR